MNILPDKTCNFWLLFVIREERKTQMYCSFSSVLLSYYRSFNLILQIKKQTDKHLIVDLQFWIKKIKIRYPLFVIRHPLSAIRHVNKFLICEFVVRDYTIC